MKDLFRVLSIFSFIALTGCQLSDNAQKSAQNSGVAADNSNKLLDLNNNAFGDGRSGGARDRREKALSMMFEATTLDAKLANAAAYFNAFEFQLYKDEGFREDNEEKRARMFADAVAEMIKIQKDFDKVDFTATPTMSGLFASTNGKSTTSVLNAFAFAGAMHKLSERQRESAVRYGFEAKTMFDIFAKILSVKAAAEADPQALASLPNYAYEGLREINEIIDLFNLRMNLFGGTAARILAKSVSVDASGLNIQATAVQLQDATDRLKGALQAKMVLGQAQVAPKFFSDVQGGLQQWVAAMNAIPSEVIGKSTSPKMNQLMEVKALAEKLAQ